MSNDRVSTFLQIAIHAEIWVPRVIAKVELADAQRRKDMATLLRGGVATRVLPGIYSVVEPLVRMLQVQYGVDGDMPPPHIVARALARQYGWRLGLPTDVAKFVLGLIERPLVVPVISYDQDHTLSWPKIGLTLEPGRADVLAMTPSGQAIVLGLPLDISESGMIELAESAGMLHADLLLGWLREDIKNDRLTGRFLAFAEAVLKAAESEIAVPRRAPATFVPPTDPDPVTVRRWQVRVDRDGDEFLTARVLLNHPSLGSGDSLASSSPLCWIDESIGWAKTRSRMYRLDGPPEA